MKKFNYNLPFHYLDFTIPSVRNLYTIGSGEQGVLLIRPYTDIICKHWRFRTPEIAKKSSSIIYEMFLNYLEKEDFIGADMARKFLEMGFTRARRYANHHSGRKYGKNGEILPQELDSEVCHYAKSARIFLEARRKAAGSAKYKSMRKQWREKENITDFNVNFLKQNYERTN